MPDHAPAVAELSRYYLCCENRSLSHLAFLREDYRFSNKASKQRSKGSTKSRSSPPEVKGKSCKLAKVEVLAMDALSSAPDRLPLLERRSAAAGKDKRFPRIPVSLHHS